MAVAAPNLLYLPDDCWQHVFKFLTYLGDDEYDYIRLLKSFSVISKEFFSITNRLRYSLTISNLSYMELTTLENNIISRGRHEILYERLPIILQRFSNLTSINLSFEGDLNNLLIQISQFPLKLTSLTFSGRCTIPIPADGLRAFSQKITTVTSLTCCNIESINSSDIFFIADCFPLLEELDLGYGHPCFRYHSSNPSIVESISFAFFKLRKVNLSGHDYINDKLIFNLFKNCKLLEEAKFSRCSQLTNAGIASALLKRPTLKSLSFDILQGWAMLAAFTRNCPSLCEITVNQCTRVYNVENFNSFVVSPQLKYLRFALGCWLTKESIKVFALFPNLVRLDLRWSDDVSGELMCQLLRMCCKLKHLDLSFCRNLNVSKMNFVVPKLEVLNLRDTRVDDKALHVISKSCCGLLQLILASCRNVTEKGVKHVVENCTQLRVIDLCNCLKVDADVAALILLSRPSLKEIICNLYCYKFS